MVLAFRVWGLGIWVSTFCRSSKRAHPNWFRVSNSLVAVARELIQMNQSRVSSCVAAISQEDECAVSKSIQCSWRLLIDDPMIEGSWRGERNVPARRKVVQLGPNWFQKLEKKYMNWKTLIAAPGVCSGLKRAVAIMKRTKSARKPVACTVQKGLGFRFSGSGFMY